MDSIFDSLPDQSQQQPTQPAPDNTDTDMQSLLAQATAMANQGGPGANADVAQQWLEQQMQARGAKVKPASIFDNVPDASKQSGGSIFSSIPDAPAVTKDFKSTQEWKDLKNKYIDPLNNPSPLGEISEDVADTTARIGAFFHNYHQEHQTIPGGTLTLQDEKAAKLLGINYDENNLVVTPQGFQHDFGTIYKMSPEEQNALTQSYLKQQGMTGASQAETQRVQGFMEGDWSNPDFVGAILRHNLISNLVQRAAYPEMPNTKKYYAIKDTAKMLDVLDNPSKYSPQQVREARAKIDAYKKEFALDTLKGTGQAIKAQAQEAVQHPWTNVKQLGAGLATDPEMSLIPEVEYGNLAMSGRETAALAAMRTATKEASTARKVAQMATGDSDFARALKARMETKAEAYERVAQNAKRAAKAANLTRKLGNVAGSAAAGAGLNAAISAEQQIQNKGYVQQGSLELPAATGGIFGLVAGGVHRGLEKSGIASDEFLRHQHEAPAAVATENVEHADQTQETPSGVGGIRDILKKEVVRGAVHKAADKSVDKVFASAQREQQEKIDRDIEGANRETAQLRQGEPGTITQPQQPGQPIPTDAPINDSGTIPYTGGVSKDLKETHIDKNFPTTLPIKNRAGQTITVPVKDIVAKVHEAEEAPLMHPTQPLSIQQLRDIVGRAGKYANNKVFSPGVRRKIIAGEPLTYPEAHEIATAIENNHVDNTYNMDPKVYQSAMKPYIKDIADRSEEEPKSDIPANLDTKPYDDMDHPEVVEGQAKPSSHRFGRQSGAVSPTARKLMAAGALGTIGATYGYGHDKEHPLLGAAKGAAAAIAIGRIPWLKMYPAIKKAWQTNNNVGVRDLLNTWDYRQAAAERVTTQLQDNIRSIIPSTESQVKLTHYLEGDKSIQLTPQEQKAAQIARNFYDHMAEVGIREGILGDVQLNYVNHEWRNQEQVKTVLDKLSQDPKYANMSPEDRHAMARSIVTIAKGKQLGLTPRTENIVDLMGIYSKSMNKALANKELLTALKNKTMEGGMKAVMPSGKAPRNYVAINHPQLNGLRVDPSIASSLGFLFKQVGNSGIDIFNTALKREETGLSLFHPVALVNAFLTANDLSHPLRNLVDIASSGVGKSRAHKMYQTGGPGDIMDMALQAGLKITPRQGEVTDEDVNTQFYEGLHRLQDFADTVVPGTGTLIKGYEHLNKASDRFVWENVHTGLKGITFMNAYEKLKTNWALAKERDPTTEIPPDEELARQAASYTNDTFGGLNWRRLADDATTHLGRVLVTAMASPGSRRAAQLLMFAPDWTYSTIRSFLQASQKGTGLRGLLQPRTLADLHRQYIMRNAILYLTLYNGLNMALSGHPIWDNKKYGGDMFMLDLGDGRHMAINKHAYEVPHAVENPPKYVLGKMGILPSEALDQLLGKEYLTPTGGPPMKESRVMHAAKRLEPFSMNALLEQGPSGVWSNLAGLPIYGRNIGREQYKMYEEQQKQRYLQQMQNMSGGQ